jgi:hypothetical protein
METLLNLVPCDIEIITSLGTRAGYHAIMNRIDFESVRANVLSDQQNGEKTEVEIRQKVPTRGQSLVRY